MRIDRYDNTTIMYLHGNQIAKKDANGVTLYDCGWNTPTTKERLNGILRRMGLPLIYQKKGVWYIGDGLKWSDFNNKPIDASMFETKQDNSVSSLFNEGN